MTDSNVTPTLERMIHDLWKGTVEIKTSLESLSTRSDMTHELVKELKSDVKGHAEKIDKAESDIQDLKSRIVHLEDLGGFTPNERDALRVRLDKADEKVALVEQLVHNPPADIALSPEEVVRLRGSFHSKAWIRANVLTIVLTCISLAGFYLTYVHPVHH